MTPQKSGTLKTWNDARGFGFVRPDDGSEDVFLHIRALPPQSTRPEVGQRVRYQLVFSADLKPRAAGARLQARGTGDSLGAPTQPRAATAPTLRGTSRGTSRRTNAARTGRTASRSPGSMRGAAFGAGYGFIAAFAVLFMVCSVLWSLPLWLAGAYVALSVITFAVYAADKHAAQRGGWRVSEKNLLLLGLAGGWPGAIVAQQQLRHKSVKTTFRAAFWASVWLNVLGFLVVFSPAGQRWLGLG